jgi:hypothetical protein
MGFSGRFSHFLPHAFGENPIRIYQILKTVQLGLSGWRSASSPIRCSRPGFVSGHFSRTRYGEERHQKCADAISTKIRTESNDRLNTVKAVVSSGVNLRIFNRHPFIEEFQGLLTIIKKMKHSIIWVEDDPLSGSVNLALLVI